MHCLVIGGSGQDGVLVSAQLLAEGHRVTAVSRSPSVLAAVDHRSIDVTDKRSIDCLVAEVQPSQIYYLAAYHRASQEASPPLETEIDGCFEVNTLAFGALLAAVERHAPDARTLYASSSRVFGLGDGRMLDEASQHRPVCPYGLSKMAGMKLAEIYRRERGLFVSSAILFNHESELRGATFLSKKLVLGALAARSDPTLRVTVGSLEDVADWFSARDAAAAMRGIIKTDIADDFVVASGSLHSVRDFAEVCFAAVGLEWLHHVTSVPAEGRPYWRLVGDSAKILGCTGWRPSLSFTAMVHDLITRTERYERQRPTDFHSYL
jgi:GDPmannose 4,6-dehydratase